MKNVLVELSPAAYLALCGLVRDALEVQSDATPLLQRTAQELSGALTSGMLSDDLAETHIAALRTGGFMSN